MTESVQVLLDIIETKINAIGGIENSVKFNIEGHTPIMVDKDGVRQEDGPSEATLSAKLDTFLGVFTGKINPALAFMSGKITLDGDAKVASKLKSIF